MTKKGKKIQSDRCTLRMIEYGKMNLSSLVTMSNIISMHIRSCMETRGELISLNVDMSKIKDEIAFLDDQINDELQDELEYITMSIEKKIQKLSGSNIDFNGLISCKNKYYELRDEMSSQMLEEQNKDLDIVKNDNLKVVK